MSHKKSINTEELEKHIAEKMLEEKRKSRERIFLTALVLGCMVALYIVFTAMGADSSKELQKEVKKPRFESPSAKKTSSNKAHK
ncbi:MAG: hypothetical protein ACOYOA_13210 [Saprospiraceae bacterium]